MNIVSKTRLSLRKLFTALLAVGPLAVLPSPVWAVIPTSSSFTTTSGTVSLSSSGTTVNINFSDKAILTWGVGTAATQAAGGIANGATNFNVGATETWNFASTGSVLNKVSKGTGTDAAVINGALLGSSAKVFILADGGIVIGNGAQLNTQNLVLSTVPELADAIFLSLGDLAYSGGSATGGITIGGAVSIGGNLTATASSFTTTGASITAAGDVVLRSLGNTTGLVLPTTTVNGNLSVSTVNGAITQAGAVTVGAVAGTQTATLNAGTADITLANAGNNFDRVALTGNVVTLKDANIITIGNSTVGSLGLRVGGQPSTTAISTDGALVTSGDVSLESTSSYASGISIASGSSIGGVLSAATFGGSVSVVASGNSTTGNLTVGNITNTVNGKQIDGATYTASTGWTVPTATSAVAGADGKLATTAITVTNAQLAPIYSSAGPTITVQSPIATAPAVPTAAPVGGPGLAWSPGTSAAPAALVTGTIPVIASSRGFNYDGTTTVSVIGGGGSGATATPVIDGNGQITAITITAGGAGYISAPTLVISNAKDANVVVATAAPVMDAQGRLTGATITNAGAGYSTAVQPAVTIAPSVNTGASVSINTTSNLVTVGTGLGAAAGISTSGINSDRAVTLRGASVETQGAVNLATANQTATVTSTAGGILFNSTVTVPRLAVTATGGNITQNSTNGLLATTNTTVTSSFSAIGNEIVLNTSKQAAVLTTLAGQNSLANSGLVLSGANVTIGSNQTLTVASANVTNNLTVQSGLTRNIVLGSGTGSDATHVVVGGVLTAAAGSTGTITDNNDSNITSTGGMVLSSGSGAITIDGPSIPGALTSTIRTGSVSASTSGAVTIAETTSLNLGNIGNSTTPVATLTAISTTGSIVDSGNIYATTASFKVSGNNNIVLDNGFVAANALVNPPTTVVESKIGTISIDGGVDNSITNLNSDVTVAAINNATGTTTVSTAGGTTAFNGRITLGNISTGNLSVNSAGGFIDVAGNVVISGNLSLSAGGVVPSATTFGDIYDARATIDNAKGTLTGLAIANSTQNAVAANRSGMLTYAVAPTVAISGGGITAGAAPNPAGLVTATLNATTGQLTGFNVTNSALTGTTAPYNNTAGATTPVVTTITGATNTSIVQTTGALKVAGTTTITTNGTANLYRNNDFNNVVLANSTGSAIISDINSVNVSGTTAGMIDVRAGVNGVVATNVDTDDRKIEGGAWGVTLGNINAGSIYVSASNGGAGNTGRIVQSTGATIFSYGTSSFTTSNNSITLANAGNSFGRVQLTSGGGAITFVEDGSIRLGSLSSGNATVSLTSRTGSIIEDSNAGVGNTTLSTGSAGNVTLSAATGSILLGNTTQVGQSTTGSFTARVNASAPAGQVALISSGNLSLGSIDANSLTVATTGTTGEITQAAAAKVYGTTSFTAASGNIAITNADNNFGRVFVSGNAAISIVENGTLNLGRVTMPGAATGNFSATSVNGDIVDTGLSQVRPGGAVGNVGTGVVSLTASNGNITLDDPTTEFPTNGGVVFNAKNVTLAPLGSGGGTLILGAANQTSSAANLNVTSATGSIGNAGAVKVSGDASFQTGTGNIDLTNSGNAFGSVRFAGAVVSITEADDIALASGSSATGAATFNSVGGSISIVNKGGTINLNSTGLFTASGNITLAKLIQANGTITVSAPGTKDLSALSLAGDLAGKAPTNIGTGTYLPPSP